MASDPVTKPNSAADHLAAVDRPVTEKEEPLRWGSDAVAAMVRALGIPYLALTPGASYRGLHDSLVNFLGNRDPQMLVCLHEEHAVAIAHGYAKATGKPMGVVLHSNVGLMHGSMAIFNAWCDRVPMLILGATGPVDATRRRPWIDWVHTTQDQAALVRHFTKWDDQPASVPAALESLLRAAQYCETPPKGPVYITLDVSLQEDPLEQPIVLPDVTRFRPAPAPTPDPESVGRAAEVLAAAEHPVILLGRGGRTQEAWQARVRLAEALGAVVLSDLKTGALFPTEHPCHGNVPANRLSPAGLDQLRRADVVLSLDWVDLGSALAAAWQRQPVPAQVVQCSLDSYNHNGWGMEYMGLAPVDIPMQAEADQAVPPLLAAVLRHGGAELANRAESRMKRLRAEKTADREAAAQLDEGSITTRDIARTLGQVTAGRKVSLLRVASRWDTRIYPFREPMDYLGYDGGAGIGSGPGMSVGAALGLLGGDRLPVAVLGDGDFLMGSTALWTAAHFSIPMLIIVANNKAYYNDVEHQRMVADRRERPTENRWIGQTIDGPPVDLAGLARAQGFEGEGPVTRREDLLPALQRGLDNLMGGGCYLIDVHISL